MSGRISVDIAELRDGASELEGAPGAPAKVTIGMGDLGSRRADAAFEHYYPTWSSECSSAARSVQKLSAMLRSAADEYARRDTEAATAIDGGSFAF